MRASPLLTTVLFCLFAILLAPSGCDDTTEPENQSPSAPQITPLGFAVLPGDSVLLMASSRDPDNDALTYAWVFGDGTPSTAEGATVSWRAPAYEAEVSLTVAVSDGRGGHASSNGIATVTPNAAYPYGEPFGGTMEADLSLLSEDTFCSTGRIGTCHFWASAAVLWTNSAVVVFTGLPTLAFLEALTHTPVWLPLDTWRWAYTIPWGSSLVTVELYATLLGPTTIDWQMLIYGTLQEYEGFQWVTGTSHTDAASGSWILYDHRTPHTQTEALEINWAWRAENDRDLDYHNILEGSGTYGDSLSYQIRGTMAEVRLYDVSEETFFEVRWDVEEGSGKFIGAGGDSCCWGPAPTFDDIDCE